MGKILLLVMDSVGIGEMPDAAQFGDKGADTLGHLFLHYCLKVPNMIALGLGNIEGVEIPLRAAQPRGAYGKAAERLNAKDTTGGHWEMAGVTLKKPFPVYPHGFPKDVIDQLEKAIGRRVLGNVPASGTVIIQQLGDEHVRTGQPIVYTSADSVLQIAAHEKVIPLSELYEICKKARAIMTGDHAVGRVIARPFVGQNGKYVRTENRRDFSLEPPRETMLDHLKAGGYEVIGVGKIEDIFCGRGLTQRNHTTNNQAGMLATAEYLKKDFSGLIFTNLVDFDMLYGHRRNPEGYAQALEELDAFIPTLESLLGKDDIMIITADHGCDPTKTDTTDHTREYIPILVAGQRVRTINLGVRKTFADIAATIAQYFDVPSTGEGTSFLEEIWEEDK